MSASKDHLSLSFLSRARFYFREALQLDLAKVDWSVAFRNSLGIGLTVIFGILFLPHDQALALIVGALQTSAYDNSDSYQVRARRLLLTSLFGGIAVLCAGLASPMAGLTSVLLVGFGFFTGMMWSLGTEAADLSIITLVTFAIFAATPMTTSGTLVLSFSVLVGGLIQSALSISLWWFRRFRPESRALGVYFQELSLLTQIAIDLDDVPPASAASIRAHEILSSISRDPRDAGSRYRSLLSQAEMARVSILNLVRLRGRLVRQPEQAELVRELDAFLRHCCQTLVEIAESLKGGAKFQSDLTFSCDSISNLSLRKRCRQLESALHASQSIVASLRGHRQVRRRAHTSRRALRLRFFDPIESLRANLNFSSSIFRHACRLSVCLLIGEIIKNQFTLNRSYWLSMTIFARFKACICFDGGPRFFAHCRNSRGSADRNGSALLNASD